jgi:hypothetical protein
VELRFAHGGRDRARSEMVLQAEIQKLRDALGGHHRASLEMHLEAVIERVLEIHLEAEIM